MARVLQSVQYLMCTSDRQRRHTEVEPTAGPERQMIKECDDLRMRPWSLQVQGSFRLPEHLERTGQVRSEEVWAIAVYAVGPIAAIAVVVRQHQQAALGRMALPHLPYEAFDEPDVER